MKALIKISIRLMVIALIITSCTKDDTEPLANNPDPMAYLKFGATTTANDYGLFVTISANETTILTGDDFTIDYIIENTSNIDFNEKVYISLDLIYNKPDFTMGESMGDYYSLLWWNQTDWGRTTKTFELAYNDSYDNSVNVADIGWISFLSSAIQPDYPNLYELIDVGVIKFQLSIMIDDSNDNDPETAPTVIYSNVLDLTIE